MTGIDLGSTIGGYRILAKIGEGGVAKTYKALQLSLTRVVCLKVLRVDKENSARAEELFNRESLALASLSHPNIVTVYDRGMVDGRYFLVMEYVEGSDLGELLSQRRLSPSQIPWIIRSVASALQYVHEQGILHRDVKPRNVLVSARNHVKVVDFGLARMSESINPSGSDGRVGTPNYAAPEILTGRAYDHRADLFSFAVLCYQLLAGGEFPKIPLETDPLIPEAIRPVLAKALKPKAKDRQASVREFADELLANLNVAGLAGDDPGIAAEPPEIDSLPTIIGMQGETQGMAKHDHEVEFDKTPTDYDIDAEPTDDNGNWGTGEDAEPGAEDKAAEEEEPDTGEEPVPEVGEALLAKAVRTDDRKYSGAAREAKREESIQDLIERSSQTPSTPHDPTIAPTPVAQPIFTPLPVKNATGISGATGSPEPEALGLEVEGQPRKPEANTHPREEWVASAVAKPDSEIEDMVGWKEDPTIAATASATTGPATGAAVESLSLPSKRPASKGFRIAAVAALSVGALAVIFFLWPASPQNENVADSTTLGRQPTRATGSSSGDSGDQAEEGLAASAGNVVGLATPFEAVPKGIAQSVAAASVAAPSTGSSESPASSTPAPEAAAGVSQPVLPFGIDAPPQAPTGWRWTLKRKLAFPYDQYTYLAPVGDDALVVATFNNRGTAQNDPKMLYLMSGLSTPKPLLRIIAKETIPGQRGYSGVAASRDGKFIFYAVDGGTPETSFLAKLSIEKAPAPAAEFGAGGKVSPGARVLGLAVTDTEVLALVAWGEVRRLDMETGAAIGTLLVNEPVKFRDLAGPDARGYLFAYGAGQLARWNLASPNYAAQTRRLFESEGNVLDACGYDVAADLPLVCASDRGEVHGADELQTYFTQRIDNTNGKIVDFACSPNGQRAFLSALNGGVFEYELSPPRSAE